MDKTVTVELAGRSYDVRIGEGVADDVGATVMLAESVTRAVVISDQTVSGLYGPKMLHSLADAGIRADLIDFPPGEPNKTLATCGKLYDRIFALDPPVDRGCMIVALGGGVPGDVAGFIAATTLRGLRWVQCPTTLLADVDASVGGKTGVDHPTGKNLIGAFHQPRGVFIDVEALQTLPAAELGNGLAECIKHAVIRDANMLEFLEDNARAILACRSDVLTELIARNVAIKAAVVSADEREAGERAHLNFGHTVGHAIETLAGHAGVPHGNAVSLGMVAECHMAVHRGLIEQDAAANVEYLLGLFHLPIRTPGLDANEIWRIMRHDKKARDAQVRIVLPVVIGQAAVFDDITPEMVTDAVEYLIT